MAVGVMTREHAHLGRRSAPIASGAAVLCSGAFLATHNPSGSGVHYPGCVFHQATGLWCPGCGLTRGCYELLHGNVGAAVSSNLFTPLAVLLLAGGWVAWLRWSWTGRTLHASAAVQRLAMIGLPAVVLVYGVIRNIPAGPFRSLAP